MPNQFTPDSQECQSRTVQLNLAVGMARSTSLLTVVHAAITIPIMLWLLPTPGNYGAAAASLAGSCVIAPLSIYLVGKAIKLGAREVRPLRIGRLSDVSS